MEFMYGMSVYKEAPLRRGVVNSTCARPAGYTRLDEFDLQAPDAILENLTPLFKI